MRSTFASRVALSTLALLLVLPLIAAPARAWGFGGEVTEEIERTVAASATVHFEIENTNGSIRVRSWDRPEVEIRATKKADSAASLAEIEVRIEATADRVSVETRLPQRGWDRGSASVEYEIQVPRGASVDARSTNGDVDVEAVGGQVEARTTNGGIDLRDVGGNARASSTNGGIHASGLGGALVAHTTNGTVRAEIDAGDLADDVSLETTNGSVELTLASDVKASVYARTGNGSIRSDFPEARAELDRHRGEREPRRLEVDLNGGGPKIELRSSNGSVRLRRR